jgi:hypothetical protein
MDNSSSTINSQLVNNPDHEMTQAKLDHELNKEKIEQGWVGKIWGGTSNSKINIAALIISIAMLFAIFYSCFVKENAPFSAKDCWTTVTPIITLALGYIFGDKKSNKNKQ